MTSSSPSRRRLAVLIGGIVLLLLLAWGVRLLTAPRSSAAAKAGPPAPVQVTTARVKVQDVPVYRAGIGTVTATASVVVKARVDGQLQRVGFTEGQDVKAGQLLAQLDPRTFQAQLAQAKAQRARDQATLGNARADLKRYTTLIADDAATQQQLDTQKALVAQLEAAVQTDDAQIQFAQVQLGYTTITAPISGRVGVRLVDAGNIVRASDANGLVVINQIDPISVVFTLPEEAVPDINKALAASRRPLEVEAFTRADNALLATGTLLLVNNQIDTSSGTVQLKATFPNASHGLWPGQFVNARLNLGQRSEALTIPDSAVQRGANGTYVYVVDDAKQAQPRPIRVAVAQGGIAVVDKGLAAGERVVVAGQYKLRPGAKVAEAAGAASRPASGAAAAAAASAAASGAGE